MKKLALAATLLSSMSVFAGTMSEPQPLPWHVSIGIGYVNYEGMVDANTVVQRLSGARDIFTDRNVTVGVELAAQTGLDSRLWTTQLQLNTLGGPAIQTVIKPFFDLLATAQTPINLPVSFRNKTTNMLTERTDAFVKVGMAYRQMHFDRDTIGSKTKISPEVQVGLSKAISQHTSIALAYQGIYASKTRLTIQGVESDGTGTINTIPTQNGGLLTFIYHA